MKVTLFTVLPKASANKVRQECDIDIRNLEAHLLYGRSYCSANEVDIFIE